VNWLKSVTAETVVVHTRDGRSIRGVLVGVYRQEVVLAHASLLHAGGDRP
jgi:small nuclear ribonucleoprotein (snRNP)-like protein